VLAAFSTSAATLIAARALLGIAGATLMPSTLALIRNTVRDPGQHTFAIGLWMTSFTAGFLIGPLLGGALLMYFWLGSVFLMGPVALLLAAIPRRHARGPACGLSLTGCHGPPCRRLPAAPCEGSSGPMSHFPRS
jgi:MFS family permease